jgi:hypothetical protein
VTLYPHATTSHLFEQQCVKASAITTSKRQTKRRGAGTGLAILGDIADLSFGTMNHQTIVKNAFFVEDTPAMAAEERRHISAL